MSFNPIGIDISTPDVTLDLTPVVHDVYSPLNVPTIKLNPRAMPFSPLINMGLCEKMTVDTCEESPYTILQNLRVKNVDRILLGHINLNSIKHKFHMIYDLIKGKIDIF